MEVESRRRANEFAIVRAEESGVTIYAVPGENPESHQSPVRLDAGELYIMLISECRCGATRFAARSNC